MAKGKERRCPGNRDLLFVGQVTESSVADGQRGSNGERLTSQNVLQQKRTPAVTLWVAANLAALNKVKMFTKAFFINRQSSIPLLLSFGQWQSPLWRKIRTILPYLGNTFNYPHSLWPENVSNCCTHKHTLRLGPSYRLLSSRYSSNVTVFSRSRIVSKIWIMQGKFSITLPQLIGNAGLQWPIFFTFIKHRLIDCEDKL